MADDLERLRESLSQRYRVDREVGHGGMATVFLAHDPKHDRPVAIKVLKREVADSISRERFLREIALTARLDHPHILALLDSGESTGLLYYVMPYVSGESLRARLLREKHLPWRDALRITLDIVDALSYAHALDVVHRDIKPENILLGAGHARVADFGIARALTAAGRESLTVTGLAIGTPAYMSPEQASGDQLIDGRSDTYSVGCLLYEMLAGQPPFKGSTAQSVLAQHMTARPRPVRDVRPDVPAGLAAVVAKALEKRPDDRFARAEDLASALRVQLENPGAGLVSGVRRLVVGLPPSRRRGVIAATLIGMALALGLATVQYRGAWVTPSAQHLVVVPQRVSMVISGDSRNLSVSLLILNQTGATGIVEGGHVFLTTDTAHRSSVWASASPVRMSPGPRSGSPLLWLGSPLDAPVAVEPGATRLITLVLELSSADLRMIINEAAHSDAARWNIGYTLHATGLGGQEGTVFGRGGTLMIDEGAQTTGDGFGIQPAPAGPLNIYQ